MSKSKILVLVSGSIAAYKACYLVSRLKQAGYEVKIAASKSALNFVGSTTFEALSGELVASDTFETGGALDHIYLMRWADLIIACPATGNFINKTANGIADDFLTTLSLAHDFSKPFLIAPAMNTQMYMHPATQNSVSRLKEYGFTILETASGVLACAEVGSGKLLDPDLIFDEIESAFGLAQNQAKSSKPMPHFKAPKVLITSGGCVEAIDDVRAITNTSSGQTGAQIANHLYELGFEIDFVCAKNGARPHPELPISTFTDFKSLEAILNQKLASINYDAIIHAAAISDYGVSHISAGGQKLENTNAKIASDFEEITITLKRNPKLINSIKSKNPNAALIGFKLTRESDAESVHRAIDKQIGQSSADLIVHNSFDDIANEKAKHQFNIFDKDGKMREKLIGTNALSGHISNFILERLQNATHA